jgi:type IV secretion system protein VirB3
MSYRDPIFRGCTRPALFLGAPMVPTIILTGLAILLAMLGLFVSPYISIAVITAYVPIYAWMRVVTKSDDQRLNQLLLRLRMRARMLSGRRVWRALTYTPVAYKRR